MKIKTENKIESIVHNSDIMFTNMTIKFSYVKP